MREGSQVLQHHGLKYVRTELIGLCMHLGCIYGGSLEQVIQ